jgi:hypothetical protein
MRICIMLCLIVTGSFSQDSTMIVNLDLQKLREIEKTIKLNDSLSDEKIKRLEASITNQNFIRVLKSANTEKFKNDVAALKGRYVAGEEILNHIIRETNSFNLSYQQLVLQGEFASLTNPLNYSQFTSTLTQTLNSLGDKKPIPDITLDVSALSSSMPFLNNPVVSSGLSIASYFIAKYNDKRKFESESFKSMTCVLNFTSSTDSEYKLTIQRIYYLRDKIEKYNSNIKEFFTQYLKSIGYNDGYIQYSQERNNNGSDFLESERKKYFDSILSDTVAIGLVGSATEKDDNVSYYMEQVKFYIAEYEEILRDIGNSIIAYEQFYTSLESTVNNSCDGIKTVASPKLAAIKVNMVKVKDSFKIVDEQNRIPASLKRTLLGL